MRRWAKFIALFALVIAVVGAITPDECRDSLLWSSQPASISSSHDEEAPFGCKYEEDCFCCAHFAPVQAYVDSAVLAFVDIEHSTIQQTVLAGTLVAPYHPPRA